MIDFHSHVLPGIDDGSQSVEESVQLLSLLADQGCSTVVATPHFYAERRSVDEFLERREQAWHRVQEALPVQAASGMPMPEIRLGGEVAYYAGISRLEALPSLRLQGSRLLLLEMPHAIWSDYVVDELIHLSCSGQLIILLAHVERYLYQQRPSVAQQLLENGVLMQVNASFFLTWKNRRKALKLLENGEIHLLGSDTHNLTVRPPRIGEAAQVIRKKLGDSYLKQMENLGRRILQREGH